MMVVMLVLGFSVYCDHAGRHCMHVCECIFVYMYMCAMLGMSNLCVDVSCCWAVVFFIVLKEWRVKEQGLVDKREMIAEQLVSVKEALRQERNIFAQRESELRAEARRQVSCCKFFPSLVTHHLGRMDSRDIVGTLIVLHSGKSTRTYMWRPGKSSLPWSRESRS